MTEPINENLRLKLEVVGELPDSAIEAMASFLLSCVRRDEDTPEIAADLQPPEDDVETVKVVPE